MNNFLLRIYAFKSYLAPIIIGSITAGFVSYVMSVNPEIACLTITSFIVFIVSVCIMQMSIGVFNIRHLTIPGFWYLTYLAMIFIPSFLIFFERANNARYTYIFAVESVLLTVPLGILFANIMLRFKRNEIKGYYNTPIQEKYKHIGTQKTVHYIVILFISIGLVILYIFEVKKIPLFFMFDHVGEVIRLGQLREESFKLLDSPLRFVYHLLRDFLFPLLIVTALGYYLYSRKRIWLYLLLGTFTVGILYAAFSLARLPVAMIIFLSFLFLYLYHSGKINKKIAALASCLVFGFPILVLHYLKPEQELLSLLKTTAERIFLAPANILYYYYEVVPKHVGFLYGQTMGKLTWLIGKDYFDISNYVSRYINPTYPIKSGSANSAFIGDLHANFGILGILFGGFVTGIIMQIIQIHILRQQKTVFRMAVYAFLMYEFMLLNILPLTSVLIFSGIPFLVFITCMGRGIRR